MLGCVCYLKKKTSRSAQTPREILFLFKDPGYKMMNFVQVKVAAAVG